MNVQSATFIAPRTPTVEEPVNPSSTLEAAIYDRVGPGDTGSRL